MFIQSTVRILTILALIGASSVALWPVTVFAQTKTSDTRQRLILPAEQRDGILAEMRLMLEALSGVIAALSRDDPEAAAVAARSAGVGVAVDATPVLQPLLPPAFLSLGMATHQSFDRLADSLAAGATTNQGLSDLANISQNCTACHATFRIDEAR